MFVALSVCATTSKLLCLHLKNSIAAVVLSNVLQSFSALSTLMEDFHHELHECTRSRAPCISIVKSAQNTAPVFSNVRQNTAPLHQSCSKCTKTLHHHTIVFKVQQNSAPSFLCTRVLRLRPPPQSPLCRVDHLLVLLQIQNSSLLCC